MEARQTIAGAGSIPASDSSDLLWVDTAGKIRVVVAIEPRTWRDLLEPGNIFFGSGVNVVPNPTHIER